MQTHRSANTVPKLLPNNNKPLVDRPNERVPSSQVRVHYDFPDQRIHPAGWYVRRHLKRKNLRRTNQQYQATDRVGIRWSIMPLSFAMIIVAALAGGFFAGYNSFTNAVNEHYQGKIATLVDLLPGDSLRMYDEHDILIYEAVDQGLQVSEPLNNISANLMHAEIAIEDQNFWTNPGYDITGIVRAALSDVTNGRVVAGGSTITQQLIKNVVVGNQDTIMRKLQEIILARRLPATTPSSRSWICISIRHITVTRPMEPRQPHLSTLTCEIHPLLRARRNLTLRRRLCWPASPRIPRYTILSCTRWQLSRV